MYLWALERGVLVRRPGALFRVRVWLQHCPRAVNISDPFETDPVRGTFTGNIGEANANIFLRYESNVVSFILIVTLVFSHCSLRGELPCTR